MYGVGLQYNKPRFNEILVITNTIQKHKHKIYLNIMNNCQRVMKMNAKQINKDKIYAYSNLKQCYLPVLEFLVP